MKSRLVLALLGLLAPVALLSCAGDTVNGVEPADTADANSLMHHSAAIIFLVDNFDQLPEKQVGVSEDSTVYAQYAQPTTRYPHGILGDAIEAGQLIVLKDGEIYTHTLDDQYVFEDIRPRLFDVDNDGQMEMVTIRTHVMNFSQSLASQHEFTHVVQGGDDCARP